MVRPGAVWDSANGEDSERTDAHGIAGMVARVEQLRGQESTPIFDALLREYNSELSMNQFMGGALRIISDSH